MLRLFTKWKGAWSPPGACGRRDLDLLFSCLFRRERWRTGGGFYDDDHSYIALDHWDDNDNGFDDGSDHNGDGCCGSVPPFFNFFQAIDPGTICQLRSETWKNHHLFKHNLNSPWKKHVAGNCFMWKLYLPIQILQQGFRIVHFNIWWP